MQKDMKLALQIGEELEQPLHVAGSANEVSNIRAKSVSCCEVIEFKYTVVSTCTSIRANLEIAQNEYPTLAHPLYAQTQHRRYDFLPLWHCFLCL